MVSIFKQTIINILCNFIPHETVLFDDRDPPWMSKEIKKLIHEKNFQLFPSKQQRQAVIGQIERSSGPIKFSY